MSKPAYDGRLWFYLFGVSRASHEFSIGWYLVLPEQAGRRGPFKRRDDALRVAKALAGAIDWRPAFGKHRGECEWMGRFGPQWTAEEYLEPRESGKAIYEWVARQPWAT